MLRQISNQVAGLLEPLVLKILLKAVWNHDMRFLLINLSDEQKSMAVESCDSNMTVLQDALE
jgi:hypothetical protein